MQIENVSTEDDLKNNNIRIVITSRPPDLEAPISTRPQDWEERAREIIFGSHHKHRI